MRFNLSSAADEQCILGKSVSMVSVSSSVDRQGALAEISGPPPSGRWKVTLGAGLLKQIAGPYPRI